MQFARRDHTPNPRRAVGARRSPLTLRPRSAAHSLNAILNYLHTLLEVESCASWGERRHLVFRYSICKASRLRRCTNTLRNRRFERLTPRLQSAIIVVQRCV